MARIEFTGLLPAVITPFTEEGKLDTSGLTANLRFYLESGVTGLVMNGSTGEAAALLPDERVLNVRTAVKSANGKVKIVAGVGAPATAQAVSFARAAEEAGADGVLALTPYDIIPNKDGLYRYYKQIAESVNIPVIAYNLPQHTGVNIGMDTLVRLVDEDIIQGIKESSGSMSLMAQMIKEVGGKISILTGADDLILPSFAMGCSGAILAMGNIAPKECVDLINAVRGGKMADAKNIYFKMLPIALAIGSPENFPAPVKEAVRLLGRPAGPCRSPVVAVTPEEKKRIGEALKVAGLVTAAAPKL